MHTHTHTLTHAHTPHTLLIRTRTHPSHPSHPSLSNTDELAGFSNWGSRVDIQAPGVGIKSAKTGGGYTTYSGTSMACPHVAGVVAMVLQKGALSMTSLEAVKTVTVALLCDAVDRIYNSRSSTTEALVELPSNDGVYTC
jgi:subtilisin family serine protease